MIDAIFEIFFCLAGSVWFYVLSYDQDNWGRVIIFLLAFLVMERISNFGDNK